MPYCLEDFIGIGLKDDSHTLGFAQKAENVDLSCGRLDPWRTPLLVTEVPEGAESIHRVNNHFRHSNRQGTAVHKDYNSLVYSANPCDCIQFRKDWCEDPVARPLGLPKPTTPTIERLGPEPTDDDCWKPELCLVQVTYESKCGWFNQESEPSRNSNGIKCMIDEEFEVTIPPADTDKYPIDFICVYVTYTTWDPTQGLHGYPALGRNLQGRAPEVVDTNFETNGEIECFQIARIPYTGEEQTITIAKDKCFGRRLKTTGWTAPREGWCIAGCSPTGSLVAYDEECLYYSVRNHPGAFRFADVMGFGCTIMFACTHNLQTFVFLQNGSLMIVQDDNDPVVKGSCRSVQPVKTVPKPCVDKFNVNKATLCDRYGVVYPSDEGLAHVLPDGNYRMLIKTDKGRQEWCNPVSLAYYRDNLFMTGFADSYVIGFPLLSNNVPDGPVRVSTTQYCPKCWYEECGELFMLDFDGKVYKWDAGDECLNIDYESAELRVAGVTLTTVSVEYAERGQCDTVPCPGIVSMRRDGKDESLLTSVKNSQPRRMTRIANARTVSVSYYGTEAVRRICLGSSLTDIGQAATI